MQSHGSAVADIVENIFSLMGNPIVVVLVLVIELLFLKNRVRSLVHLIYITGALYYVTLFKQIFQEARPFWFTE